MTEGRGVASSGAALRLYITKDNGPYKKGTVVMMEAGEAVQAVEDGWAARYPEREKSVVGAREVR